MDSSSFNHIDVIINKGKEDSWRFTDIYGLPSLAENLRLEIYYVVWIRNLISLESVQEISMKS